jgi:hypothetical protein
MKKQQRQFQPRRVTDERALIQLRSWVTFVFHALGTSPCRAHVRNRSRDSKGACSSAVRCGAALKRAHVASRPNTPRFLAPIRLSRERAFPEMRRLPSSQPCWQGQRITAWDIIQGGRRGGCPRQRLAKTKLGKENDVLVLLTPYPSQTSARTVWLCCLFRSFPLSLQPSAVTGVTCLGIISQMSHLVFAPLQRLQVRTGRCCAPFSSQRTRHVGLCFAVKRHSQRGQECMIWRRDECLLLCLRPSKPRTHVSI